MGLFKPIMRLWSLIILALLFTSSSISQIQQEESLIRLRLAQGFEQAGDWEKAVSIYESLLSNDPHNFVYFDGLRRSYTQLKEYDRAIELIRKRLILQPNDPVLLSTLGGLYFQKGEEATADSIWGDVINSNPSNINLYRLVASQMMEYRLYETAIEIYQKARKATFQPQLFGEEIAVLYGALMQYGNAAREYVAILASNPEQLPYVQSRLSAFTHRPDGLKAMIEIVEQQTRLRPEHVPFRSLYSWLLMEAKEYDKALEEHRVIDRLTKANGEEIFNFGQRAVQEKIYRLAARAFKEVVDQYPSNPRLRYAKFGFVRASEELSIGSPWISQPVTSSPGKKPPVESQFSVTDLLTMYDTLAKDYPHTDVASQSLFRIGVIKRQRFHDRDGALSAFEQVRSLPISGDMRIQASLQIAEIMTEKNMLGDAHKAYEDIRIRTQGDLWEQATFRIAELYYYQTKFDTALTILQSLTQHVNRNLANDALQLQYFIQENKSSAAKALNAFAETDLVEYQGKFSEALARFEEIRKQHPTAPLLDDTMIRIGDLLLKLQRPDDAIQSFQKVVREMRTSILRDKAQMRIAEIYEMIKNDTVRAIEAYEQILAKFPTSVYLEEARLRIRVLRGDTL